jgi:CheY-like chemotaxis protein
MSTDLVHAREQFAHHVQRALFTLYDPAMLSGSLLISLFGVEAERDPAGMLRQILMDAIESLKPNEPTPHGSRGWRVYQVLRRRYTEQLTQHEVAVNLGLSIRQLQREEKIAREVIAERLWAAYHVAARPHLLDAPHFTPAVEQAQEGGAPSAAQELEAFSKSTPVQIIQLGEVVQEVLGTLQPILALANTRFELEHGAGLPPVAVKAPMLRQALYNLISVASRYAIGGTLHLQMSHERGLVLIHLRARGRDEASDGDAETLEMARQLLDFCQATLSISTQAPHMAFQARVEFQVAEVFTVLVIDDNADARQLLQRYLHGTPYQFIEAEDAAQALALIHEVIPRAIILDVMMPRQDGWTLIGQLRNHPRLQGVPIIISTILPQRDLAYALGAAEFIRKPIRRPELLAVLARQLGPQTGSPSSP